MNEKLLISLGLSQNQAKAYRALVIRKSLRPTQLMMLTGESRSNCYAILDKLVELRLATKEDFEKKLTYYPASPLVLKMMLDQKRAETEQQLQDLDKNLPKMLSAFHEGGEQPEISYYKGKGELEKMYVKQMEENGRELYFIRSKADLPFFGLEKMQKIRYLAPKYNKRRFGITPIISQGPSDHRRDARAGGLKRAWVRGEEYTANVEWAVSGNTVQAILLKGEGYGISITNPEIAESFRQILKLLFTYIKKSPDYNKYPKSIKHSLASEPKSEKI